MTDEPSRSTRRSFVKTGAAAAAIGLTTSGSGCVSELPPLGSKPAYARVDVPGADPPDFRKWLPAPGEEEYDDDWLLTYHEPGSFEGPVPEEFVARRAFRKADLDHFGVGFENYDALTLTKHATVLEGGFTAAGVADALADTGYEPDGSYREFDLFVRSDVHRRVAVSDGTLVWTNSERHDAADLERTVDAGAGRVERYHEVDDGFATATEWAGTSRTLYVGTDHAGLRDEGTEIGADAFRFDDDAAYHVLLERYPSGEVPSVDDVKRVLEDQRHELTEEAETVDVDVAGQAATIEARVPLAPNRDRDPRYDPPQVTWGASFDDESRTVRIRHEAGEAADADWLWYDVATGVANEIEKEPLWPDRDTVEPGAEATVDLSERPDATGVKVVYGPEDIGSESLFTYSIEGDE